MHQKQYTELLDIAIHAAKRAGAIIQRATTRTIKHKGRVDLVTETDLASEAEICSFLQKETPNIGILTEEGGGVQHGVRWIIDPLDGTTNFAHGFPHYAVSIGLEVQDKIVVAVIYAPCLDEIFSAQLGKGSWCNGKSISVSKENVLGSSLLATGFPYDRYQNPERYTSYLNTMLRCAQGIRRAGSAALDLAYIGAGRLDGFWELGLKPWDMAAGILIIQEAGGTISDLQGKHHLLSGPSIVASNSHIHTALITALNTDV